MARKSPDGGATATAERKTRNRKSPKQKAETLTVRVINALDSLGYMADKLTEAQREAIDVAVQKALADLTEAFKDIDDDDEDREPFSLPD